VGLFCGEPPRAGEADVGERALEALGRHRVEVHRQRLVERELGDVPPDVGLEEHVVTALAREEPMVPARSLAHEPSRRATRARRCDGIDHAHPA